MVTLSNIGRAEPTVDHTDIMEVVLVKKKKNQLWLMCINYMLWW